MRVLVTGADGFVARHLIPLLLAYGNEVVGTALDPSAAADLGIPVEALDVTKRDATRTLVGRVCPTHLVHLAAVSSVSWSFENPHETHRVNVEGTRNLLEAVVELPGDPRVLLVGSAEEYGKNEGRPLPELPVGALRPLSPYAASKVAVEKLVESELAFHTIAVRTRSFPHFGPGQSTVAFTAHVASMLVAIERREKTSVLRVGNLDAVRDYTDVRDVISAYVLLLERGTPGEVYNVCSGHGVAVRALLENLLALSDVRPQIEPDPERLRPSEIPTLVGDNTKLRETTGWTPEIPIEQTLRDVMAWWRREPVRRS